MTPREKNLAIVVGALLVLVAGYFAFSSWSAKVEALENARFVLESEVGDKEERVMQGERAYRRLQDFRMRSLPADAELARSEYKAWLLDLAAQQIGLEEPVVTSGSINRAGEAFHRISLAVSGRGTLRQLTEFLYRFYGTDLLHGVRSLDIQPIDESRVLEIHVGVDALVVNGAAETESLSPQRSAWAKENALEDFLATILNRNLFAPANRPPQIASVPTQRIHAGELLSLALHAEDPDQLDKVTFALAEESPEDATLGERGALRFRAENAGTYELTVIASDDGLPPRTARMSFNVVVTERPQVAAAEDNRPPRKPEPHFEDGQFAYITAITQVNDRRELWLNIRTSGETLRLSEGDTFEIKRLEGVVRRIGEKEVDVTAAGESRRFELGENLAEGTPLATPASGAGE